MRAETSVNKINRFMVELGKAVGSPGCIYFTGGVSAVLFGWRDTTLDVDLKADPEPQGFFEALPRLKDSLDINIELAAPDDFIPALPEWRERSPHIATHGSLVFCHYDFYSQALAKIERFHARDQGDVQQMLTTGLVQRERLWELFKAIEPGLIRFPAIDAAGLHRRVNTIVSTR